MNFCLRACTWVLTVHVSTLQGPVTCMLANPRVSRCVYDACSVVTFTIFIFSGPFLIWTQKATVEYFGFNFCFCFLILILILLIVTEGGFFTVPELEVLHGILGRFIKNFVSRYFRKYKRHSHRLFSSLLIELSTTHNKSYFDIFDQGWLSANPETP